MESLRRIVAMKAAEIPEFRLDRFQEGVLANLYLEFFFERCRVLITPDLGYLTTGEVDLSEPEELEQILATAGRRIEPWRRYVIVNLALYTALLETNSYYLTLNDHLMICRFVEVPEREHEFYLKLYTIARDDLPHNYTDKIYLGRDHVSLLSLRRPHFGVERLRDAAREQLEKLSKRLHRLVPHQGSLLWERQYLEDLGESLSQLDRATDTFLNDFPATAFTDNLEAATLLDANQELREIKHVLIEAEDTLREMETTLMDGGFPRAARYATKFRKDVTNDINFLMVKVNGRISNVVNRIDALSDFS